VHLDQFPPESLELGIGNCHDLRGHLKPPGESIEFFLRSLDTPVSENDDWGMRLFVSTVVRAETRLGGNTSSGSLHAVMEAVQLPYPEFKRKLRNLGLSEVKKGLSPSVLDTADGLVEAATLEDAILSGLEVAFALELCRQRQGKYPALLADLAPLMPKGVPKDPFSTDDFIYRLDEEKCTLYSVGPDMKDDGGDDDKDYLLLPQLPGQAYSETMK
jgi:hypothetical protein